MVLEQSSTSMPCQIWPMASLCKFQTPSGQMQPGIISRSVHWGFISDSVAGDLDAPTSPKFLTQVLYVGAHPGYYRPVYWPLEKAIPKCET